MLTIQILDEQDVVKKTEQGKNRVDCVYQQAYRQGDHIRISSDVEDNSDIPERLITTQFKRYTIEIVIDDAYLFDVKVKDNLTIVEGHLHTMGTPDIVEDRELIFKNK